MNTDPICILGMHRSGTSFLANSLKGAGLYLGNTSTSNRYNRPGNFENIDFVKINDEILSTNGGSWISPPRKIIWHEKHKNTAAALIKTMNKHSCWGFKDPRTLLTLDGWIDLIPSIKLVGIFRHPDAVCLSIQKRNPDIPEWLCYFTWYRYNRKLYEEFRRQPFPLLCFDWEQSTLKSRISKTCDLLGFNLATDNSSCFDPSQRHITISTSRKISNKIMELYEKLLNESHRSIN